MAEKGGEGWTDQPVADPVGRLRTALDRIAFALDRRKNATSSVVTFAAAGPDLQPVVASIDALMTQIRDVLEHEGTQAPSPVAYSSVPAETVPILPTGPEEDPYGDVSAPEHGSESEAGNFHGGGD